MENQTTKAFEEILDKNKDKIYRICKIYAVTPLEPQDLFQDVIYAIWKSLESFRGNSSIDTWVYRITLNICLRSKQTSENIQNKTIRLDSIQFASADLTPDKHQQEKYEALTSCINLLDQINKSIVILHLEELPYKEIATITGLTENHIAVKMKRIRNTLLHCITKKI